MIIVSLSMLLGIIIILYSPLNSILRLKALSIKEVIIIIIISFISVFWYEIVKLIKKAKKDL